VPTPKVYVDLCCLKRPFDVRQDDRITLEAEASVTIIELIEKGKVHLISSGTLIVENNRNPRTDRRETTQRILNLNRTVSLLTTVVETKARRIHQYGLRAVDALHIALAEAADADAFITRDEGILKVARRQPDVFKVKVVNPIEFLLEEGFK
jgi:predicted nucleic acid-binding protein